MSCVCIVLHSAEWGLLGAEPSEESDSSRKDLQYLPSHTWFIIWPWLLTDNHHIVKVNFLSVSQGQRTEVITAASGQINQTVCVTNVPMASKVTPEGFWQSFYLINELTVKQMINRLFLCHVCL